MRWLAQLPAPLPCAILFALGIALTGIGRPARTLPPGTRADDRGLDRIVGTVAGPVITTPLGSGALVHTPDTAVWVWTPRPLAAGERIAVTGRLRTPRGFSGPGSPDRAATAASRGAAWELSATHVELLADDPDTAARIWRWAARTQRTLAARIIEDASEHHAAAALAGIVTGDRAGIPPQLDARWRAVGIYHVLSVSGLHLAVIAGLAFALLRRLVAASPLGARTRPARWAAPAALVLAIGYTLVTGAQLATLRALLVVTIVLVGNMLDRPVRLVDALGAAAIAILAWRPQDLHDPSFQLSFVAALTLALLPSRPPSSATTWRARGGRWLVRGLVTSAWVAVTTAPITALHFQQVAAGGLIGNLLLTPIVELAALPLGLAGAIVPGVGAPLVELAVWLVARVDDVAGLCAHVLPVATLGLSSPLVAAVLVATALWSCSRRARTRLDLVAWVVLCGAWTLAPNVRPPGALRVTFLDVGQGDAALIELPGGAVWLVDAGGHASSRDLATASAPGQAIARALTVYGHARIDRAFLSHPHPDHYLGFARLGVPIGELWIADGDPPSPTAPPTAFARIAHELAARGTRIVRPALGTTTTADGVSLHVWAPRYVAGDGEPPVLAPDPVRSVNDNSLVFILEYGGRTILFAGDLESEGEDALVAAGLPAVDIVKVAHHGSPTSSSPRFVAATRPELAVISCGVANMFGFPAPAVLERWRTAGAAIARTDVDGAITVTIGPRGELDVARHRGNRGPGP